MSRIILISNVELKLVKMQEYIIIYPWLAVLLFQKTNDNNENLIKKRKKKEVDSSEEKNQKKNKLPKQGWESWRYNIPVNFWFMFINQPNICKCIMWTSTSCTVSVTHTLLCKWLSCSPELEKLTFWTPMDLLATVNMWWRILSGRLRANNPSPCVTL